MPPPPPSLGPPDYIRAHFGEDKGPSIIGANVALTAMATLAVVLRLWAKSVTRAAFMADDLMIIVSLVLTYGICVDWIISVHYCLGKHFFRVPAGNLVTYGKLNYAGALIYTICLGTTRLSVLLLYRRLFVTPRFCTAVLLVGSFVFAQSTAFFFMLAFRCTPVSRLWETIEGHCVNLPATLQVPAVVGVVTDILILILPLPVIWALQVSRARKLALTSIFVVGGLACAGAIVRLYFTLQYTRAASTNHDLLWLDATLDTWSNAEPCIGICCACLPVMGPLVRKLFAKHLTSSAPPNPDSAYPSWPKRSRSRSAGQASVGGFHHLHHSSEPRTSFRPLNLHDDFNTTLITAHEPISRGGNEEWPLEAIQVQSTTEWSRTDKA